MEKRLPEFKNEDEEREFWATHDSSDYVNWSKAERAVMAAFLKNAGKNKLSAPEKTGGQIKK
jgi:hypothetical protein